MACTHTVSYQELWIEQSCVGKLSSYGLYLYDLSYHHQRDYSSAVFQNIFENKPSVRCPSKEAHKIGYTI